MKQGVLVVVLLCGMAGSAGAAELAWARNSPSGIVFTRATAGDDDFRRVGPETFDLAVRPRDGRGLLIYRYYRARMSVVLVERVVEIDIPIRTGGFSSVSDSRIVLTPEGYKKPIPPQPPGGEPIWVLPDVERRAALAAVGAVDAGGTVISIGQLPVATL
ncbi:hypothetical protein CYFUS_005679 [Cystobacter fuscus]|uniref:Uncharacterized protein n=1 Tax=Cystobacter fuscus TaxID=43 RepID=A0A250J9Z4_9BACT|nr:hypothetical protein [Cystobacter fuscus]ATB40231.1 hypothetical protein CYFUS_005679 [Cystobacter fuscus]